jgi:putative transposase
MKNSKFVPGEYYHIYNRGNAKQKIFHDTEDYERFIKLLYVCNSKQRFKLRDILAVKKRNVFDFDKGDSIVDIVAYVLMPNHYHILFFLPTGRTGVEISSFVKKVSVGYSAYYNQKYNHSGTLFEGGFKSIVVNEDLYLKYLFSYIHLNPIKLIQSNWKEIGIRDLLKSQEYIEAYKFSSFIDWINVIRPENKIINKRSFELVGDKGINFKNEVYFWLNSRNKF